MSSRPVHGGMGRIGGHLIKSLAKTGALKNIREQQAAAKWDKVVGTQIAAATAVDSVRDGVMFVCCKSSMWSNELDLHKADILKGLNAGFRESVIKDIRLTARGFAQAKARKRREEEQEGKKSFEAVPLDECDIAAADKAASCAHSGDLAEKIRKAVLTSKMRAKVEENGNSVD